MVRNETDMDVAVRVEPEETNIDVWISILIAVLLIRSMARFVVQYRRYLSDRNILNLLQLLCTARDIPNDIIRDAAWFYEQYCVLKAEGNLEVSCKVLQKAVEIVREIMAWLFPNN